MRKLLDQLQQRTTWQVAALYIGGSWVLLQAVDLFADNMGLPGWVFPISVVLLSLGLPIVLATMFVQRSLAAAGEVADETHEKLLTWRNMAIGGAGAFLLLFGFAGLYVVIKDRGRSFAPTEAVAVEADPGIAVLPFTVSGPDLEHYSEGMVDLLFTNFDGVPGIRPISPLTVLANWHQRVAGDTEPDLPATLAMAESIGARYAVVGSAVAVGSTVRLAASVYEVSSSEPLGQAQESAPRDSIWRAVDRLAIEILEAIGELGVGEMAGIDLRSMTTDSPGALSAYLRGQAHYRRAAFEAAASEFDRAIAADSGFGLAHFGLSQSVGWNPLVETRWADIEVALQGALETPLTERQELAARAALGTQAEFMRTELAAELEIAVRRYPDDAQLWYQLGEQYLHVGTATGAFEDHGQKAEQAFERAVELAPDFAPYRIHPIELAFIRADSLRVTQLVEEFHRVAGGSGENRENHILLRIAFNDSLPDSELQAGIDSLETLGRLFGSYHLPMAHPRYWRAIEALIERRKQLRPDWKDCRSKQRLLMVGLLGRFLSEAVGPPRHRFDNWCVYAAHMLELPVPERLADSVMAAGLDAILAAGTDVDRFEDYAVPFYSADKQRWADYDAVLALWTDNANAAPDTSWQAKWWGFWTTALDAYGEWRRDRPERAVELFESLPPEFWLFSPEARWWLGNIYMELERPADAARQFRTLQGVYSVSNWTPAHERAGQAYEQLGDVARAREQYAYFVDAWKNADPELQPWVDRVRESLARLGPLDQ